MSKRKLIASDFDGTIGTGARLQDDIEAIKAFQEAGHLFGMVSGRNADSLRYVCERAGINCDFRLSDSGSICYMAGKPVFTNMIDRQVMIPLAEFLMEKETDIISVNRVDGADLLFCRNSKGEITVNVPRDQWVARPFSQMCGAFKSSAICHEVARELEERFPMLTALPNWGCLDIVPKGRDKAVGLLQLADLLGIDKEDIYVVGDNYNDIAMLDAFKSFVVENACDEVKTHATVEVTPSVGAMVRRVLEM